MKKALFLLLVVLFVVIVVETGYYLSLKNKGPSVGVSKNPLAHIEILPNQKFDKSGRDLIYIKSTIQNRVDFTANLGWNTNATGVKRHFVGLFDSIKKVNGSYVMTLRHTSNSDSQKETFLIQPSSGAYLSVLNLSDPELKIYKIMQFDKLNLSQLNKLLHENDIVHVAVVSKSDKDNKIVLSAQDSMWMAEYVSIRRFNGLQQVLYEL